METTANHPIYSADIKNTFPRIDKYRRTAKKNLVNVGQWCEAKDMYHKQWATPLSAEPLDIPTEQHTMCNQKDLPVMDSHFWYFVGRWLGDGWVRDTPRPNKPNGDGNGGIYLCDSASKEQELRNTVSHITEKYSVSYERAVVKVCFTSQLLCRWLTKHFGKGAINKHIPGFVYGLPVEYRVALFNGIMDSDGYKLDNTHCRITSISKALVLGIRFLAESLGWSTSTSYFKRKPTCVIEGRTVNQHDTYAVAMIKNPNRRTGIAYEKHKWYLCRSATPTGETKTVYNISVDEDESYIADSIVVHNCQDISVAGKQEGINRKCSACGMVLPLNFSEDSCPKCGAEVELTRSGLFMEQIRIIKEMRKKTNECFPKIVIWENVSAATNSNNGDDFYCVLSEFAGLFGEKLPTLRPEKWCKAGEIVGDKGSLAWRTLDAQYWGVPQRRRRIYLVVDLTGQRAGEILFKSESLRRHTPQSEVPWKGASGKVEDSIGAADRNIEAESKEVKPLAVATQQVNAEMGENVSPTLTAANGTSGSNRVYVVLNDQGGDVMNISENITGTLRAEAHGHAPVVVDSEKKVYGICSLASNCMKSDNPDSGFYEADIAKTLDTSGSNPTCNQGGNVVVEQPVYCIQGNCIDRADTAGCNGKGWTENVCYTLTTIDRPAVVYEEKQEVHSAGLAFQQGPGTPNFPYYDEQSPTLTCSQQMAVMIENHPMDSRVTLSGDVCQTLSARMGTGGGNVPLVMETNDSVIATTCGSFKSVGENVACTLMSRDYKDPQIICQTTDSPITASKASFFTRTYENNVAECLVASDYKDPQIVLKPNSIVRRLTPLECSRLQGFPDRWVDGESDAAQYKALGNSVALPCVNYVMSGVVDVLDPIE